MNQETTSTDTTALGTTTAATTAAVSTQPEPYYKGLYNEDGSINPKNWERLPDELKDLRPTLERQKDINGILHDLKHSRFLAGQKALAPLPPGSPPEVVAKRKELLDTINGVPKDVKEYGIAKPADLPDVAWNPKLADGAVAWAQKYSVAPSALKELVGLTGELAKSQLAQQEQYTQQFWTQEQKTFEATIARDNIPADRATALVEKGAIALGLNLQDAKTQTFLKGADARLMAMRHALAIGEDSAATQGTGTEGGAKDYYALARDIQANPANPEYAVYRNTEGKYSRSQHESVVNKVNEYLRLAEEKKARGGRR